jgi:hypothetical protein
MFGKKIGRRQLDADSVQECRNFSGKNTYIYTKQDSIILEADEIDEWISMK